VHGAEEVPGDGATHVTAIKGLGDFGGGAVGEQGVGVVADIFSLAAFIDSLALVAGLREACYDREEGYRRRQDMLPHRSTPVYG